MGQEFIEDRQDFVWKKIGSGLLHNDWGLNTEDSDTWMWLKKLEAEWSRSFFHSHVNWLGWNTLKAELNWNTTIAPICGLCL